MNNKICILPLTFTNHVDNKERLTLCIHKSKKYLTEREWKLISRDVFSIYYKENNMSHFLQKSEKNYNTVFARPQTGWENKNFFFIQRLQKKHAENTKLKTEDDTELKSNQDLSNYDFLHVEQDSGLNEIEDVLETISECENFCVDQDEADNLENLDQELKSILKNRSFVESISTDGFEDWINFHYNRKTLPDMSEEEHLRDEGDIHTFFKKVHIIDKIKQNAEQNENRHLKEEFKDFLIQTCNLNKNTAKEYADLVFTGHRSLMSFFSKESYDLKQAFTEECRIPSIPYKWIDSVSPVQNVGCCGRKKACAAVYVYRWITCKGQNSTYPVNVQNDIKLCCDYRIERLNSLMKALHEKDNVYRLKNIPQKKANINENTLKDLLDCNDVQNVLKNADHKDQMWNVRDTIMFIILIINGSRPQAPRTLTNENVFQYLQTIDEEFSIQTGPHIEGNQSKNKNVIHLWFPGQIKKIFKCYIQHRHDYLKENGLQSDFIFIDKSGKGLATYPRTGCIMDNLKKICETENLKPMDFRKYVSTKILENKEVSHLEPATQDHSNPITLRNYNTNNAQQNIFVKSTLGISGKSKLSELEKVPNMDTQNIEDFYQLEFDSKSLMEKLKGKILNSLVSVVKESTHIADYMIIRIEQEIVAGRAEELRYFCSAGHLQSSRNNKKLRELLSKYFSSKKCPTVIKEDVFLAYRYSYADTAFEEKYRLAFLRIDKFRKKIGLETLFDKGKKQTIDASEKITEDKKTPSTSTSINQDPPYCQPADSDPTEDITERGETASLTDDDREYHSLTLTEKRSRNLADQKRMMEMLFDTKEMKVGEKVTKKRKKRHINSGTECMSTRLKKKPDTFQNYGGFGHHGLPNELLLASPIIQTSKSPTKMTSKELRPVKRHVPIPYVSPERSPKQRKIHGEPSVLSPQGKSRLQLKPATSPKLTDENYPTVERVKINIDKNLSNSNSSSSISSITIDKGRRSNSLEKPEKKKYGSSGVKCSSLSPVALVPWKKRSKDPPLNSGGWSWVGDGAVARVYLLNDDSPVERITYHRMTHEEGDEEVKVNDCILLASGTRRKDLPFIAKVTALWENPDDGEMMISLLWYYRPEQTDGGRQTDDLPEEIFASKHRDQTSVACVEDKCYVLTLNEFRSYKKIEAEVSGTADIVPEWTAGKQSSNPRNNFLPTRRVAPDRVFLCRKIYDSRGKKFMKNLV